MDEEKRYQLEQTLEELESYRGRHTELITVLIPAGFSLNAVAKQLDAEKSTASNIKSKNTRKAVLDALERITRQLKLIERAPENGLAIFCGNISQTEGQENIKIWTIEPPMPLKTRLYRCDQTFVLEPLKEMLDITEVYGLIVVERNEATIGVLEGKQIRVIRKMTSGIPGQKRAGGQSSQRFHRITESMAIEFYKRIALAAKDAFFNMPKLKAILVGGPGPTKEDFLKDGDLVTVLREKVLAVKDIGYSDEHGLELLVNASREELEKQDIMKEKKILEKFMMTLGKHPEKVSYGYSEVKRALKAGAVQTLILSKKIKREFIEELSEMGRNISSEIEIVSDETPEGAQFLSLSGIGARLRFGI